MLMIADIFAQSSFELQKVRKIVTKQMRKAFDNYELYLFLLKIDI